jgi:hypothetical protein
MAKRSAWASAAVVIRPSASAVSAKYCFFMDLPLAVLLRGRCARRPWPSTGNASHFVSVRRKLPKFVYVGEFTV